MLNNQQIIAFCTDKTEIEIIDLLKEHAREPNFDQDIINIIYDMASQRMSKKLLTYLFENHNVSACKNNFFLLKIAIENNDYDYVCYLITKITDLWKINKSVLEYAFHCCFYRNITSPNILKYLIVKGVSITLLQSCIYTCPDEKEIIFFKYMIQNNVDVSKMRMYSEFLKDSSITVERELLYTFVTNKKIMPFATDVIYKYMPKDFINQFVIKGHENMLFCKLFKNKVLKDTIFLFKN